MKAARKVAILGGGEEELNILSEFHRDPAIEIVGIYDRDHRAVALEIAEIIGVPVYSDRTFIEAFKAADHVIVAARRALLGDEIRLLRRAGIRLMTPSESASRITERSIQARRAPEAVAAAPLSEKEADEHALPWPQHLERALIYIDRITDRERLLKWLLEIAVRSAEATSGSIMLLSEKTNELYIGYAMGLSQEIVSHTRQKVGSGIAGAVAASGRPRLTTDVIETPLYREGRERSKIMSAVSVPLVDSGRLLGVLNISTEKGERELGESDLELMTVIASKIAPILKQHLRIDTQKIRESEYRIRSHIESLFKTDVGFHEKFAILCRAFTEILSADNFTIYTATDEGDWLILGGSDQHVHDRAHAPRIHCMKGSLARSYLQREEVLLTEARHEAGLRLAGRKDAISSFYLPLEHDHGLGVCVIEFSNLDAFESFLKLKDVLKFQLGFFVYTQLKELRQIRRMKSLEILSSLTPTLLAETGISAKFRHVPKLLSSLVGASMGSFHFSGREGNESVRYGFPEEEEARDKRIEYDAGMLERLRERAEPECIGYLSVDINACENPPLYRSIILYPMLNNAAFSAYYIGYDRKPMTPLDPSVFGSYELDLLERAEKIIVPLICESASARWMENSGPVSFDALLKSNQKILLDRMHEEIERAERYHHGFIVTLFRISGLERLFDKDCSGTLDLVNEISTGIRDQVRKTDYFSWIETEVVAVISLESHNRIEYLENRLLEFIADILRKRSLYDEDACCPTSAFAVYPGNSDTAADLIREAKARLGTSS